MKRMKKKLVVLRQNDNIQASKNDSSSEEFEVEKPEPKLLPLRKRQGEVARGEEHLEDEEEKKLDEELSGCGTDFADMTKEEKHELLEAIRASKQEYAQEELLHNLRQSQETNITVTTRLRRFDTKSNTDGNPLLTQNSKKHSPPDGSGDCTKKLSDVASGTKTPKKLRLRRRPQLQITTENERCNSVNNSTRKRTSAVESSRPAKVSKRSDESGVKLEQNQNSLPGTEKLDCVVLLETTDVTPKRDDVIHTSSTATQHADLNLTQDGATIKEDTPSSDDSSVIFEKMETPNPKSNKSQPQEKPSQNVDSDETQDLFSNNDSPSGGATSQTSAKGYHGKSNENEASQGSNSASKDVATGPQKRKLDLEGDGPSAKRPIFWAWDYLQVGIIDDKILGKIAPESPTRKLINKRALKRKLIESRRYFTPPGVSTGHCIQRIIEFFREEQTNMRRLQDRSVIMVPWGPPVKAGCHMTSTIELRRAEEETSTGTARCLRDHNVKVEGPKSDEEFCTVRQNMLPRILSDSDSDNTDKDVDWLPDLKERSKKPVQAHTRKPANKSAKSTKTKEKVPQDENENIESIPDTPPGGWLKSPAAQKVQSTGKTKKQLDHEETLNSILMQSQAKVEGVVPGKTTRRLGVTRRRGTGNRKTGHDTNRQGRLKCPKEVLQNLFTDDENSSGDDGGVKTKIKCEHGGTNRQEDTGKKVWNVHLEEHSTAASDYLKPTAKVQRKPPARQPGDRVEGDGNWVESKAVAKESEAVAMETKAVVVGTKMRPRGRVVSAVANIAQSVVAGAASLFRGKATRGREEGTDGTKGMLMEISSDEEEDTGEPEQQQQREEGKTADLEQKQASQQQKQAECPMCFKYFSLEGIEEHAFNCQGETASSSPQHEGAPPEGTTVAHVLPVGRLARKPLRQYGRQRIARGQTDEQFDSILCTSSDADDAVAGRLRQPAGGADTSDKKCSDSPENVEILSDSELPASPTGKRRKRTSGPNEEGETVKRHPCPICSKLFSQALIEAHVLRCLESTETDKRVTRTRRHPDRNSIHTISSPGDDDFDENMPINPKKRQTYLDKKQMQPLITSKLMVKDLPSTSNNFRKYSTVVNTLQSSSDNESNSDSDAESSDSISRNFSDDPNDVSDDRRAAVHSGMPTPRASPFRTFKRISDQGNAVLDYHNQFRKGDVEKARKKSEARASKSKKRNWKRKRKQKKNGGAPKKRRKLTR